MPDKSLKAIQAQLTQIKARQAQEAKHLEQLEKEVQARLGKGTREVKAPIIKDLTDPLIRLMKEKPLSLQELCAATGGTPQHVSNTINQLKKQGHHVLNVGEPRRARWYYVPKYMK